MLSERGWKEKNRYKKGSITFLVGLTLKKHTGDVFTACKIIIGIALLAVYRHMFAAGVIGQYDGIITGHFRLVAAVSVLLGTGLWIFGRMLLNRLPRVRDCLFAWLLILTPMFLFFILELCWNESLSSMTFVNAVKNMLLYGLLELAFFRLLRTKLIGLRILYILIYLTGTANHYVCLFRGSPILPTDLFSVRTALRVSNQYVYRMTDGMALALLFLYLVLAAMDAFSDVPDSVSGICGSFEGRRAAFLKKYDRVLRSVFALAPSVCLAVLIGVVNIGSAFRVEIDYWNPKNTYMKHGFLPSFFTYVQNMKIKKPEGYSRQAVQEILSHYQESDSAKKTDRETEKLSSLR